MPSEPKDTTDATKTAVGAPTRVVLPAVGESVGRYTILGELGAGAMGTVFLASDTQLGRRVALKLLTGNPRDNRLLDEARTLARLQHPNVVAIHDVGRWGERVYMAMEHVAGVSLATWLQSHDGWKERLDAFRQAAAGLAVAHQAGIVHHDVKPSNIMVSDDGRVRMVDFGLARSAELGEASHGGTPKYMSPEQRRGEQTDGRTDQYSLCVALYEALFGTYPFAGKTLVEREPEALAGRVLVPPSGPVPASIRDAVVKGLALEPAARHDDMGALINALALPRSRRMVWFTGGVAALSVAAAIVAITVFGRAPHKAPGKWDAILAASHLPPEQHEPIPNDPFQMTVHRLSNGLTVFISPNRSRPRVHTLLRFRAGNYDAPGVAWLALGMNLTGTEKIGTTDYTQEKPHLDKIAELYRRRSVTTDPSARTTIDAEIDKESIAAARYEVSNEYTRIVQEFATQHFSTSGRGDELVLEVDFASNRFAAWAELEADRWAHPVFRQFRAAAANTMSWDPSSTVKDSLQPRLLDAASEALFPGHPYGRKPMPTTRDVIASEPYAEVATFFRQWFVPNNAELFLVGDIDPVTAIPILEKAFAQWQPRPLPVRSRPPIAPYAGGAPVVVPSTGEKRAVYAWMLPPPSSPDWPAISVVNELVSKLANDQAVNFERRMGRMQDAAVYVAQAIPVERASIEDAQHALDRLFQQVQDGGFSDDMLEGAKRNLKIRRLVAMRDNTSRMERLGATRMGVPWAERAKVEIGTDRVTRADVVRVARAYFGRPHATIRVEPGTVDLAPGKPPRVPPATFAQGRSPAAEALIGQEVVPIQPKFVVPGRDYQERTTPGGPVFVVTDRKSELFELHVFYGVGSAEIPAVCTLVNDKFHNKVADLRWRYGIQLAVTCDERQLDIQLVGLDADLPRAIEVFEALLEEPPAALWDAEIGNVRRSIVALRGNADYVDRGVHGFAMLGPDQSMFWRADDSAYARANVAHDSMELLRHTSRTIGYYGPRSIDDVSALLPLRADGPGAVAVAAKSVPVSGPRVFVLDAPSIAKDAMVDVIFGSPEIPPTTELQVQLAYWGADAHPLATSLRGVANPTLGFLWSGVKRDAGFAMYHFRAIGANVVSVIEQLLAEIPREPNADLLERAKTNFEGVIRSQWLAPELLPARVPQWRLAGYDRDPKQMIFEELPSLGKADYMKLTEQTLKSPPTITIWGNLTGLDRKALAKLGAVTEIDLDDLVPSQTRR